MRWQFRHYSLVLQHWEALPERPVPPVLVVSLRALLGLVQSERPDSGRQAQRARVSQALAVSPGLDCPLLPRWHRRSALCPA